MGTASKVCSVIARVTELISACVVVGIVGAYLHYLDEGGASTQSKMNYAIAVASISIFFSLALMPPMKYSFYAFALDWVLFVMWMVCFGLLVNLSGGTHCDSYWYWNNWGYYWGGYWATPNVVVTQSLVGTSACSKWRAVLAFSFIGGFNWFINGCIGLYVIMNSEENGKWYRPGRTQGGVVPTDSALDRENPTAEKTTSHSATQEV